LHENIRTDYFWAKVQKITIIGIVLFFGVAFVFTGIKSCIGRGTDSNDSSIELEHISGKLDDVDKQIGDAGSTASNLAAGLRSTAADAGEIQRDSQYLEQTLVAAEEQAAAIGSGIGDLGVTDTAIREAVERIKRFIEETNRANNLP
jgi:hypothetical protein